MPVTRRHLWAGAVVGVLVSAPSAFAQAFTPPQGVGAVTFAWQWVDNTGHRFTDGAFLARGQSVSTSGLVEVDYGITDRLAATVGIPYVGAKYTGVLPPPSGLPVDSCACWHSSFQDFAIAARYRFGNDTWGVAPSGKVTVPSHDYRYRGEAVVGRDLNEVQIGISAGRRLVEFLPKASIQAGYQYSFVEKAVEDVKIDRSNGFVDFGYALTRRFFVRGLGVWQWTHGGLRAGSITGNPFPLPGELGNPLYSTQRDRLLKTKYWQAGGGASYSLGPTDVFGAVTKYVWGRDAHNGWTYTIGSTWYFDLSR